MSALEFGLAVYAAIATGLLVVALVGDANLARTNRKLRTTNRQLVWHLFGRP